MRNEILTVTPEMAKSWLMTSEKNRKLSPTHVSYLANEIKQGRWRLTHQGIAFSDRGKLLDGQHRLRAIMEAGIAVKVLVNYDVPYGDFTIIDRGMTRNLEAITGISHLYTDVYSFLTQLNFNRNLKPSPDTIFKMHKYLETYVTTINKFCPTQKRYYSSTAVRSALLIAILNSKHGDNVEYALNTYRALILNRSKDMPCIADSFKRLHEKELEHNYRSNRGDFTGRQETYYRARTMFEKANANDLRIVIRDGIRQRYQVEVKTVIGSIINSGEMNQELKNKLLHTMLEQKEKQLIESHKKLLDSHANRIELEQVTLVKESL